MVVVNPRVGCGTVGEQTGIHEQVALLGQVQELLLARVVAPSLGVIYTLIFMER